VRVARRVPSILFFLLLPLARGAAGASLVYDFRAPDAARLAGCSAIYTVNGIPLEIEAGRMGPEGGFSLGEGNASLFVGGGGLGVLSDVGSGSSPEGGLSRSEGLVFRFSGQLAPSSVTLEGFDRGDGTGSLELEMVRVFVNGAFYADVPGVDRGTVTLPLPEGTETLAVTPLLEADGVRLSPAPVLFVARIEGEEREEPPGPQ
jgi:hypothetical protein